MASTREKSSNLQVRLLHQFQHMVPAISITRLYLINPRELARFWGHQYKRASSKRQSRRGESQVFAVRWWLVELQKRNLHQKLKRKSGQFYNQLWKETYGSFTRVESSFVDSRLPHVRFWRIGQKPNFSIRIGSSTESSGLQIMRLKNLNPIKPKLLFLIFKITSIKRIVKMPAIWS